MEFRTRSKEQAIADLVGKALQLPPKHPDRPALLKMIEGLRSELEINRGRRQPVPTLKEHL